MTSAGETFDTLLKEVETIESEELAPKPDLIKPKPRRNEKKKSRKTKAVDTEKTSSEEENLCDGGKTNGVVVVEDSEPPKPPVLQEKPDIVVIEDSDDEASKATTESKKSRRPVVSKKKKPRAVQDQETSAKKQTTLTDHFKVRRSERASKTREIEAAKADLQKRILNGVEEGLEIRVLEEKGRGIFAGKSFKRGDFVCEYAGELIPAQEAREREIEYEKDPDIGSYMYFFEYRNKKYCVDATAESTRLGRLLNHSKTASNVTSKLFPINGVPYLILCASEDIQIGEELLYDYGDRSKKSLDDHPWLASWGGGVLI